MRYYVIMLTILFAFSGCLSGNNILGCGEGYEEMYGGYDYIYSTNNVDTDNSLNVTIELLNGGGGWLEESQQYEEDQTHAVTLYVKMDDGSEQTIAYNSNSWDVNGDSNDGIYWSTNLYYQSPAGFCDNGCDQLKFSAGYQDGVIYYDETCDSSPWIDL